MPFVRWARPVTFDAIGEMSTKTVHPKPDGFAANNHAALGKQIFYIRSAQCKAVIRPHRVGNDLSRKTETFKTGHAIWYFHTHPINQIPMEINLAMPPDILCAVATMAAGVMPPSQLGFVSIKVPKPPREFK